jgi:hypothetical protein
MAQEQARARGVVVIPADKLTAIAESIVEKWSKTNDVSVGDGWISFTPEKLQSFVEIILACGAAHEAHIRKHGR